MMLRFFVTIALAVGCPGMEFVGLPALQADALAQSRPDEARPERARRDRRDPILDERRTQVLDFIEDYYARVSGDPDRAYDFLLDAYAGRVFYYGREASRREILADKRRYLERWPRRDYRVRADSAQIDCRDDVSSCSVSVVIDFRAADPRSGRRSEGVTESFLTIDLTGNRPVIVSETEKIVHRW